jgi:flagellar biosynthesis/type III secretory pathway protein FliH
MNDRTCQRLKGRFFKRNDPRIKKVDINDFNLLEICDHSIAYTDNPGANIIYSKLHEKDVLDEAVKPSDDLNTQFEVNSRPVIKPMDFTEDWRRHHRRMSQQHANGGDDDELDLEVASLTEEFRQEVGQVADEIQNKVESPMPDEFKESSTGHHPGGDHDQNSENGPPADQQKDADNGLEDEHTIDDVSKMVRQAVENEPENSTAEQFPENTSEYAATETAQKVAQEPVQGSDDEFKPFDHKQLRIDHAQPPPVDQKDLDKAHDEARARGYEEGYRQGEEKAMLAFEEKINQTLGEVANLMSEFEGLKSSVLHNAQENFQILCQSLMESLLQQQFQLNPETFQQVLNRAIEEAVPDDQFRVRLSHEAFEQLKQLGHEDFLSKTKIDDDLKGFDFKIESNLTVVDGNISQIISDLLEQADTNLFDQDSAGKVS